MFGSYMSLTMHSKCVMCTSEIVDIRAHFVAIWQRKIITHVPIPGAKQSSGLILEN